MKPTLAANLALVMVFGGWLLCAAGILLQMGDLSPDVPQTVIAAHKRISNAILFLGIFALLGSLWLSGFAFLSAKGRASIVLLACLLPLAVYFGYVLFRVFY